MTVIYGPGMDNRDAKWTTTMLGNHKITIINSEFINVSALVRFLDLYYRGFNKEPETSLLKTIKIYVSWP